MKLPRKTKRLALVGIALLAAVAMAWGAFNLLLHSYEDELPPLLSDSQYLEVVPQSSKVLARSGETISEFFIERRTVVPLADIPQHLLDAIIAAEDRRFFSHDGVDPRALVRAVIRNILSFSVSQGASTITQQLARNLYLTQHKNLRRKLIEAALARKMEQHLTKESILFQYLNLIYWGHGCFGVEAAANYYFGKPAAQLTVPESALLAGMIRSPQRLSPIKAPERALARQHHVLEAMEEIDEKYGIYAAAPLPPVRPPNPALLSVSPYGVDAALTQLSPCLHLQDLPLAGLQVVTTIDLYYQNVLDESVNDNIDLIDVMPVISKQRPAQLSTCIADGRILPGCPAWAQIQGRLEDGSVVLNLFGHPSIAPADSLQPPSTDALWENSLPLGAWLKVLPVSEVVLLDPWNSQPPTTVPILRQSVASILVHAPTGEVLALYGGLDHKYHPFNRALSNHFGPSLPELAASHLCSEEKPLTAANSSLGGGITALSSYAFPQHSPAGPRSDQACHTPLARCGSPPVAPTPDHLILRENDLLLLVWVQTESASKRAANNPGKIASTIAKDFFIRLKSADQPPR